MAAEGIEVWRGGVNAWQCDHMGHLNVRFYVAQAMEGLVGLSAALGMAGAFSARGISTLLVREHHVRFVNEARLGDPLHLTAGILQMGLADARVLQQLVHSGDGRPAAVFQSLVQHAASTEVRPFAWPRAMLDRARALEVQVPEGLGPRSLQPGAPSGAGSLADAERLGLMRYGAGAFGPEHCDVFGRVSAHQLMARMSDGAAHGIAVMRKAAGESIGLAVVEYRIVHLDWPRAGDRFVVRSGLRAVAPRRVTWTHWMLDPGSGRPWAVAHAVLVPFDLERRKAITLPDEAAAALTEKVVQGWPA